jgi:hypothetical protein
MTVDSSQSRNSSYGRLEPASVFWIAFALGFSWSLYRALADQGWILDDELSHFLISRSVWGDARELLHPWSRPGRNLLQFLPAAFGLTAARLWTLGLSAIAVWLTGREARRLGMAGVGVLPLLMWFQWWFPELSYPVLTQAPFLLVWITAIFFAVRGRMILAALSFGYLGLVRLEGVALTALWGLWVVFAEDGFARCLLRRRWREVAPALRWAVVLGFWTLLPLVLANLAAGIFRGEWPVLLLFNARPTELYGSGPPWIYLRHLAVGAGIPITILLLIGCLGRRWRLNWNLLLYATYPAYLAMHSLIFWKGLFASGGYYHFIMPMAPFVALLALWGLNCLTGWCGRVWGSRVRFAVLALVVTTGLLMPQRQAFVSDAYVNGMPEQRVAWRLICPPLAESRFAAGLREASNWIEQEVTDQKWLCHHVAVSYFQDGKVIGEKLGARAGYRPDSPELTPGTLLIWDAKYSAQPCFGFTEDALAAHGWQEVARYAHGTVRIYVKD